MNHPPNEHWMSYLYGELPSSARRTADSHLRTCPECHDRVDRWRATMGLLDTDQATLALPRRSQPTPAWQPALRWALAASVILLAGFLAGRATGPSSADVDRQIAATREQLTAELRAQYQDDLKVIAAATVSAATAQNQTFLTRFNREFAAGQLAERQDWLMALESLNQQHALDIAALRDGLNALALRTGAGFQQAESQLNLLATYLPTDSNTSLTTPAGN